MKRQVYDLDWHRYDLGVKALAVLLTIVLAGCQSHTAFHESRTPTAGAVPLTPAELTELGTIYINMDKEQSVGGFNNIQKTYSLVVWNGLAKEIASVTFQLRVVSLMTGATDYLSKPITVRSFQNILFPSDGSLLPYGEARVSNLVFTYSGDHWRTDTVDYIDVIDAEKFEGPQDLHDGGHLFSFLFNSSGQASVDLFKNHPDLIKTKTSGNADALLMAFALSDLSTIKCLEREGASTKVKTAIGETVLHMAARDSRIDILDYALKLVGDVNVLDQHHDSPLDRAVQIGQPTTLKWLLDHGANPNSLDRYGLPPAYWALYKGRKDILLQLKAGGADVHYHDKSGRGWLHYATELDWNQEAVVDCGVAIDDEVAPGHNTPLMWAAWRGNRTGCIWLLKHGADPYRKNWDGEDSFSMSKHGNTFHTDQFFRSDVEQYWSKGKRA